MHSMNAAADVFYYSAGECEKNKTQLENTTVNNTLTKQQTKWLSPLEVAVRVVKKIILVWKKKTQMIFINKK